MLRKSWASHRLYVSAFGLFGLFGVLYCAMQMAFADCLAGPGATGLEVGPQTLNVTLINGPPNTVLTPLTCELISVEVNPSASGGGTGTAAVAAIHSGYSLNTGATTGGQTTGSASASAIGAVRYVFRIISLPGYAGPNMVDVTVSSLLDVGGSVPVGGVGSAGGTYNTAVTLKPENQSVGAVTLFGGSGALATGSASLLTSTQTVDINRDYELQFAHTQNVKATAGVAPMSGTLGGASSSGTARISFDVQITPQFADQKLSLHWPTVPFFGVLPPSLGTPPLLRSELDNAVSIPTVPLLGLIALVSFLGAALLGYRTTSRRSVS